jgi:hypothetical protein
MALTAVKRKQDEEEFSVDGLLDSVAKTDTGKKKSSVVEVALDNEGKKLVSTIRLNKEEVKTLTSILKMDESTLFSLIEPIRTELIKSQGYFSSLKVADMAGLFLTLSFMHKYKNIPPDSVPMIKEIVPEEKYPEWFTNDYDVSMKDDLSTEEKKAMFTAIGQENVSRWLDVKKKIAVTLRFTQEAHNVLTAEQLAQLERAGVQQIKAVKIT